MDGTFDEAVIDNSFSSEFVIPLLQREAASLKQRIGHLQDDLKSRQARIGEIVEALDTCDKALTDIETTINYLTYRYESDAKKA